MSIDRPLPEHENKLGESAVSCFENKKRINARARGRAGDGYLFSVAPNERPDARKLAEGDR